MSATHRKPNRLINEISPYLLQHAYNPVDWFPWSNEAFEKAAGEDKLVFLSIGYSTCHWCHVMEGESFEDEEIAEFLNESFVPIKVDREERPDLDNIYMTACQIMNGSGGWPLSVFMTPEKKPFFAGTYFPKKSGYGRIGFKELLKSITDAWKSNRSGIISGAQEFTLHLGEAYSPGADTQLSPQILDDAYSAFEKQFDSVNGGFGSAPKFPSPHNLMFLMRYRKRTGNDNSLQMVIKTLTEMRQGGIFDQIGFGFHRYSTDSKWFAPHFEKMLYDQALLIMAYTEAYQITGKDLFKRTVGEISAYVLRDMSSPEGGFYSAEDADSEGSEGKFYLWSEDELYSLLGSEDAEFAQRVFNTSKDGNFAEPDHKFSGTNILHRKSIRQESVNDETRLENIRVKLFGERENRVHPHKDDKLLTDWNGLMIA
ncbi:MAG: thioredoxin domain-containing protein, partial [Melioribacteraceae bacterium]